MSSVTSDEKKNVVRRAGIVGAGTLASRVLGLVRESTIAALFSKEVIDAYQVAFMLPNSFRRLTAEGAFSVSITSVFSKLFKDGNDAETRRFVAAVYGFSLLFLTLLTLAGVWGAKWLTMVAGRGFMEDAAKFELAVDLTRTMFPYIFFISLTATAMGLLNSVGRFFAPAFAPVLLNLSIIGCAVGFSGMFPGLGLHPVFALALGVLVGGVLQLLLQIPSLRASGLIVVPRLDFSNKPFRRVLTLTAPMIFSAAAYQLFIFTANAYASTLGDGAVTYINFSQRLFELPLAVLVMAISTAALPSLSGLVGSGDIDEAKRVWMSLLRLSFFMAVPAMVALIVLAEPLIAIMYQRGKFGYAETLETAKALRWIAAGMGSVALLRQTTPFFYALEKVKIPLYMTLLMFVVYAAAGYFMKDVWGHSGLCMAVSAAATVQGVALLVALRRLVGPLGLGSMISGLGRTGIAAILMGGTVYAASLLGNWSDGGNSLRNISALGLCVVAGVVSYAGFAYLLRVQEFKELVGAVRRRRKR